MIVEIDTSQKVDISWKSNGIDRIVQNVVNLLNIFKYEVAYDRTLGLKGNFIDKVPLEQAVALATAEIIEIINEREPRAEVKEVNFIGLSEDGDMQFKVVIDVG